MRRRAYIYITREVAEEVQLAVFRHPDFETMTLGVQVPGGTIELGEPPQTGALREAFEESGLANFARMRHLMTDRWEGSDGLRERHFYQLAVTPPILDAWDHTVSNGELDKGMVFAYHWVTVAEARTLLSHMGDYLHLLE